MEFNAQVNSVNTRESSSDLKLSVAASGGFGPVRFSGSFSAQRSARSSTSEERTFSMNIYVKVSQAPLPAGLERLLDILEEAMFEGEDSA